MSRRKQIDIVFSGETKEERRRRQLRKAQARWRKNNPEKVIESREIFDKYYYRYYRLENIEKLREYD